MFFFYKDFHNISFSTLPLNCLEMIYLQIHSRDFPHGKRTHIGHQRAYSSKTKAQESLWKHKINLFHSRNVDFIVILNVHPGCYSRTRSEKKKKLRSSIIKRPQRVLEENHIILEECVCLCVRVIQDLAMEPDFMPQKCAFLLPNVLIAAESHLNLRRLTRY